MEFIRPLFRTVYCLHRHQQCLATIVRIYTSFTIIYLVNSLFVKIRNSTSSKFAKSIITRLTNKQNLGGTRLIRGYPHVEELTQKVKAVPKKVPVEDAEPDSGTCSSDEDLPMKEELENIQIDDYDNENSEEEVRKIDHLMFVIHG